MTDSKSNLFWRIGGITGIIAIVATVYILTQTYGQVGLNKQEVQAVKAEIKAELKVVEDRLTKKIIVIESLEDAVKDHRIMFLEYKIEQLKKDHEQDLQILENKIRLEYIK